MAIGLIPDFPNYMAILETLGRRCRPLRVRGYAFQVLRGSRCLVRLTSEWMRARHRLLVQMVGIVENKQCANASSIQIAEQLLIARPIVLTLLLFSLGPDKIHPNELKSC